LWSILHKKWRAKRMSEDEEWEEYYEEDEDEEWK
jgi:hypothetical protein